MLTKQQLEQKKERFRPKWENLQRLLVRGVIPYTVWNFEGKQLCENCGRKVATIYPHSCGLNICCDCWREPANLKRRDNEIKNLSQL